MRSLIYRCKVALPLRFLGVVDLVGNSLGCGAEHTQSKLSDVVLVDSLDRVTNKQVQYRRVDP